MALLKGKFIADSAISAAKIASGAVTGAKIESSVALAGSPTTTTQSPGDNSTKIATTAFVKNAMDVAISGLDFQADVLDKQIDDTLAPSLVAGARYIISNASSLHADFGSPAGLANGDIVQYSGSAFVVAYDVSVQGEGALVWNRQSNVFEMFNGTSWGEFGGLSGVTAGNGLSKSGNEISINHDGEGFAFSTGALVLELDGSSLSKSASGLKVAASGITNDMLAGSIADSKLAANYIQTSEVDGSSIEFGSSLNVKALGITNAMLAGSIADSKLASDYVQTSEVDNSTIQFTGGVLNIKDGGISDAKLASDFIKTSEVDGSSIEFGTSLNVKALGITNAMLAGSIADSKLAQDYVQTSEVDGSSIEFAAGSLRVKASGITNDMLAGSIADGKLAQNYVQTSEVDGTSIKFTTQLEAQKAVSEKFTLSAGDITAQAVSLAQIACSAASISVVPMGGPEQEQAVDYTVSLTGGTGGKTLISFSGDLASLLVEGDKLVVKYSYL